MPPSLKSQISIPKLRLSSWVFVLFVSLCFTSSLFAQFDGDMPSGKPPAAHDDDPIKIVKPTIDKDHASVTIDAAFWNQKMTNWVEVAVCGRPSDFLHETVIATTTTKTIMEKAMREAGFHDADAWVTNVRDFPRIRGDHLLITLTITRLDKAKAGEKAPVETYSLDELVTFQGWSVPAGAYGWMFKGDPERHTREEAADDTKLPDRTRILRDDPQVALVFKGLQNQSQSYADHPLAYDDWIYPTMRYSRNYAVLPAEIYDSNGYLERPAPADAREGPTIIKRKNPDTGQDEKVEMVPLPVKMTFTGLSEEQFLTESSKLWHDKAFAKYLLEQLPTAKKIDAIKAEYWKLLPELRKLREAPEELRDAVKQADVTGQLAVMAAQIEKEYATLDAAWGKWASDHAVFDTTEDKELADMKKQAARWRDHLAQEQKSAEETAVAEEAAFEAKKLEFVTQTDDTRAKRQKLKGKELEARSSALLAQDIQPREYWTWEQSRLDRQGDPRVMWIKTIDAQVELIESRGQVGTAGLEYGRAMQAAAPDQIAAAQKKYAAAVVRMQRANLTLKLINVDFEIEKRETFPDDPDLPRLKKQKEQLEEALKQAPATQSK